MERYIPDDLLLKARLNCEGRLNPAKGQADLRVHGGLDGAARYRAAPEDGLEDSIEDEMSDMQKSMERTHIDDSDRPSPRKQIRDTDGGLLTERPHRHHHRERHPASSDYDHHSSRKYSGAKSQSSKYSDRNEADSWLDEQTKRAYPARPRVMPHSDSIYADPPGRGARDRRSMPSHYYGAEDRYSDSSSRHRERRRPQDRRHRHETRQPYEAGRYAEY